MLLRKTERENPRSNADVSSSYETQRLATCLAEISIFIVSELQPRLPLFLLMTSVLFSSPGSLVCLIY